MSEDDSALFLASMQGVKPLKPSQGATLPCGNKQNCDPLRHRAAQRRLAIDKLPLDLTEITPIAPETVVSIKNEGVQGQVFKLFRQGKYEVQADLDLKGVALPRARELLYDFVVNSQQAGFRNLIVIHGTGVNNKPFPAKLKSCVTAWLAEIQGVQAFHSAPKAWGGVGAMMVMLAKSSDNKQETAEQHQRGQHRWA